MFIHTEHYKRVCYCALQTCNVAHTQLANSECVACKTRLDPIFWKWLIKNRAGSPGSSGLILWGRFIVIVFIWHDLKFYQHQINIIQFRINRIFSSNNRSNSFHFSKYLLSLSLPQAAEARGRVPLKSSVRWTSPLLKFGRKNSREKSRKVAKFSRGSKQMG